jgi:thiol-disulfide isomerase/thioredoxin
MQWSACLLSFGIILSAQPPDDPGAYKMFMAFYNLWDKRADGAKEALEALEKAYPGSPRALDARKRFESPRLTTPGKAAPAFEVDAFDPPGTKISLGTFKGKYVLLDFWATWCPHCVAEMPEVHKAWIKFKDRNFDILSFSLDKSVHDPAKFRRNPGSPMPWNHVFLPGGKSHPVAEAYGAAGIPKLVLVDPNGVIVAADMELRGARLIPTLERILGTKK